MNSNTDFQKRAIAYSLLAHIRNNGTFSNGPLDIFIPLVKNALSELYPNGTVKGENIGEISKKIEQKFSLDIPIPVMRNILIRISHEINKASGKDDMLIYQDGSFWIKKYIFEDYAEQIQKSKNNVTKVVCLFKKFCKIYNIETPNNEVELFKFIEQNRADISYYLTHEAKSETTQSIIAAQFVDTFKKSIGVFDELKNIYLGSMLANYLKYRPSELKMDVELLLDTNFIISLIDLNTPESTKTCNTLIDISKQLGYTFTVLHDTIEEIQSLLSYKSQNLNCAIIAKTINREDIYNACDRKCLTSTDLDRISDNIEEMLTSKYNFHILQDTSKLRKKAKFSKEYSILKKYRNTKKSALHDAIGLIYIKEKRGGRSIKDFAQVNSWFVNNAITHSNDYENAEIKELKENNNRQPEIIKVDNLLNILWLSNPSVGIASDEIVNMGLASIISNTLNSSLPKARIIKELDDNIQKYRKDQNISDQDVIKLSTRIANRQIKDVEGINQLARKDTVAFAAKIKEEAQKQDLIDKDRAQKMDKLMTNYEKAFEKMKEQSNNREHEYKKRMQELDTKETEIGERCSKLEKEKENKDTILKKKWKKTNKDRAKKREQYLDKKINKEKRKASYLFWSGIVIPITILVISVCYFFCSDKNQIKTINSFFNFRPIELCVGFLITGLIAIYNSHTIPKYRKWCLNPSFLTDKRELIEIPDNFKEISWEDYITTE